MPRNALAQRSGGAQRLTTFFEQPSTDVVTSGLEGVPASALAAVRASLIDCASGSAVAAGWDGVVEAAELVNTGLPAPAAKRFWANYTASPCLNRLPSKYRLWVLLFRAVAARNGSQMIETAETLLEEPDKTARQIEYLVLAAATGYLGEGRAAEAARILGEALPTMPPAVRNKPWFVMERELAGGG